MRNILQRVAALLLSCVLLMPAAGAAGETEDGLDFYQKLVELLYSQDSTHYFSTMKLTIGSSTLVLDGKELELDAAPELQGERTMLPIRPIAEAAGATVEFQAETNAVLITGVHGEKIAFPIGADTMTVNDETHTLEVPSYAKNGRTYLPLRAVAEALELEVDWDQETAAITITAPYQTARILVHTDTLETDDLGAATVLTDGYGLWVIQFATPAQAKHAIQALSEQGIQAEPDLYITTGLADS